MDTKDLLKSPTLDTEWCNQVFTLPKAKWVSGRETFAGSWLVLRKKERPVWCTRDLVLKSVESTDMTLCSFSDMAPKSEHLTPWSWLFFSEVAGKENVDQTVAVFYNHNTLLPQVIHYALTCCFPPLVAWRRSSEPSWRPLTPIPATWPTLCSHIKDSMPCSRRSREKVYSLTPFWLPVSEDG